MDIKACVAALSGASGPSGREKPVAMEAMEWVRRRCRQPNLHSVGIDRFGNLFACYPCGKPNAKKIVLFAMRRCTVL